MGKRVNGQEPAASEPKPLFSADESGYQRRMGCTADNRNHGILDREYRRIFGL
jgi:hypothetical protein